MRQKIFGRDTAVRAIVEEGGLRMPEGRVLKRLEEQRGMLGGEFAGHAHEHIRAHHHVANAVFDQLSAPQLWTRLHRCPLYSARLYAVYTMPHGRRVRSGCSCGELALISRRICAHRKGNDVCHLLAETAPREPADSHHGHMDRIAP